MKSAILTKLNAPLEWEDIELTQLKFGQVKVKILTSGLCGAQLMEIAGLKGNSKFLPHLMGHEGCGIIEEVGDGVSLKIGQKVVMHWMQGRGIDSQFPEYVYKQKKITSGKVTTIGEYSICSENRLTPIPNETPNELCSLLGCGMTTALGAINNEANVKIGENALILGCGGLGLNLLQGLRMVGANKIDIVDIFNKKELAFLNKADRFIHLAHQGLSQLDKYDIIFDTTGHSPLIEEALNHLGDSGRFIMIGQPKTLISINGLELFGSKGKQIIATQGGKTNPPVDIPRYASMAISGKLNYKNIITHNFSLKDVNSAINILKQGNCGRIILYND